MTFDQYAAAGIGVVTVIVAAAMILSPVRAAVLALSAITVALSGAGQWIDGAAAPMVTRISMTVLLSAIGIACVVFAHALPSIWARSARLGLLALALILSGALISASRTSISISAIAAASMDAASAEADAGDARDGRIAAARQAASDAAAGVRSLPDVSPLIAALQSAQAGVQSAQADVRAECSTGFGPRCNGKRDLAAAATAALDAAQAAYDSAARRDQAARDAVTRAQAELQAALAAPVVTRVQTAREAVAQFPDWARSAVAWLIVIWLEAATAFGPTIARRKPVKPAAPKQAPVFEREIETVEIAAEPEPAPETPPSKPKRRRRVTDKQGAKIIALHREGNGPAAIARKLNRPQSTISDYLKRTAGGSRKLRIVEAAS